MTSNAHTAQNGETVLEKKGLDRKTNNQVLVKAETQPRPAPPWRDKMRQRSQVCCGLHPRTWNTRPQAKRCEEIPPRHACCTKYQKHYANDAEELKRYGLFKKSNIHVAKLNALNPESVFGITSMSDRHPEEQENVAR